MSETRTVVEEFFRRVGSGDFDGLAELIADEVDWNIYGAEVVPWAGRRTKRAEAVEFFRTLPDHLGRDEFTVQHLLVDGSHAVIIGHMRQVVKATGKIFDSPFAFHLSVENGKVVRYITFEDSLALARAFNVA